jgi:hypothetical protein
MKDLFDTAISHDGFCERLPGGEYDGTVWPCHCPAREDGRRRGLAARKRALSRARRLTGSVEGRELAEDYGFTEEELRTGVLTS